jgi:hypothetical protein
VTEINRSLPELASQIHQKYQLAEQGARTTIGYARECGELLAQAKGLVEHGQWVGWLSTNFPGDARTAQRWMRIASNWDALKNDAKSFLGIEAAVQSLATTRALPQAAALNPIQLFEEFTFVSDGPDVEWLQAKLRPFVGHGYMPLIEFDDTEQMWCFHTLLTPDGLASRKTAALMFKSRENGLPFQHIDDLTVALAKLRDDIGDGWTAQCEANWGDTEWVNETIDTVNAAMNSIAA